MLFKDNYGASCLCITYGRTKQLEEAIESFHRQEWSGKRELIIINDFDKQEIIYEHPEVKIINLETKFKTVGGKRNFSVSNSNYSHIFPWDDDIHLKNRIANSMLGIGKDKHYYKKRKVYFAVDIMVVHNINKSKEVNYEI